MNSINRNWIPNAILLYFLLSTIPPIHSYDSRVYANEITNQMQLDHFAVSTNEFLIDTSAVYGPTTGSCRFPVVTFGDTNSLVAWQDSRGSIYCTRISPSGEILDPAGIALSDLEQRNRKPAIAFDGMNYFAVWEDSRTNHGITGTRISQSGQVIDTAGIVISAQGARPSVAFDGVNYLVIWDEQFDSIYGARVSPAGVVLDSSGVSISGNGRTPTVAFDGTNYLVVWYQVGISYDIYAARINQSGILLDSTAIVISSAPGDQSTPSVNFDGTNYMVVWSDERYQESDIYGARVTPAGIVMDPDGFAISTAASYQQLPKIAFDGNNYLVVWRDYRGQDCDIYGARVTTLGTVLDSVGIPISTFGEYQWYPSVAFTDSNYLVVWEDLRFYRPTQTLGSRVTQEGIVVDTNGFVISTNANDQHHPSAAFDGTNYLVVWEDYLNYPSCEVRGIRVSESGVILDTASIAITNAVSNQTFPTVAYDGMNYFAVWEDSRTNHGITGTRISQSGQVIDTAGIVISAQGARPSVAFDGVNYLVVYQQYQTYFDYDIHGSLVTPAGILLDSNIVISYASYIQENPRVAFDGTNYLVVWQDHRNRFYDEDSIDIYGARVDQSGAVLDTAGIVICRTQFQQTNPDVAFDGMNYFAVWQDWYVNGYGIRGTRISQAGHVIDTTFILLSGDGHAPQISFDGENYLVVWQRYPPGSWHRDIYGVRIDTAGVLVDSFPISTGAGSQLAPTLTHGASNQIFVALSGWTDSINSQSANTMRIWGKFYPFIGVEKDRVLGLKETGLGLQVYPNPFNNLVNIRYSSVANIETVELKIYDVSGRLLKEFFEPSPSAGIESSITWDGTDQAKRQVPSGVYFLELQSGNYSSTRKLLLIR